MSLTSQFIPATSTPTPPNVLQRSTVNLTQAFVDPENTFRATSIEQMYSIAFDSTVRNFTYEVGVPFFTTVNVKFRNNTTSHSLRVKFDVPSFINPIDSVLLAVGSETIVVISLHEENAQQKSQEAAKQIDSFVRWSVSPEQVFGPVFVKLDMPSLVF
jgi:hypothetical protein